MPTSRATLILGAILLLFLAPKRVYAYIDPGTGSYVFQILLATLVSALFAVKVFWRRLRSFFKGTSDEKEEP